MVRVWVSSASWVVLPVPSAPSRVMKSPGMGYLSWFSVGYCTGFSIPQLEYSSYM